MYAPLVCRLVRHPTEHACSRSEQVAQGAQIGTMEKQTLESSIRQVPARNEIYFPDTMTIRLSPHPMHIVETASPSSKSSVPLFRFVQILMVNNRKIRTVINSVALERAGHTHASAHRGVIGADALEAPKYMLALVLPVPVAEAYLVRSKPCSSSGSSVWTRSCEAPGFCGLEGLLGGDLLALGGLLLGMPPAALEGLTSYWADACRGVLPISAYFQNGAGELVGMC